MVPVSREHADFLALAIEHGVLEPDAAVDWACEVIVAEADPLAEMVELAGLIRPQPREVIELLDKVPGSADPSMVFRRLLGLMLRQLQSDSRRLDDVTIILRQMAGANAVPKELAPWCDYFDHALVAARDGLTLETVDVVRQRLVAFLAEQSKNE